MLYRNKLTCYPDGVMPDIPNIGIRGIQPVKIHSWLIQPPVVNAIEVPVTVNIAHLSCFYPGVLPVIRYRINQKQLQRMIQSVKHIVMRTPSFTPLDYTPEDLVYTAETPPPAYNQKLQSFLNSKIPSDFPKTHPAPSKTRKPPTLRRPNRTRATQPVEAKATLTDFLPSPQQVTTTASIV